MLKLENYHLKSSSFYDELNEKEKKKVGEKIVRQEYKKGQVIFREESLSKGIYIVKKGKIKIYKSNSQGFESIVYIYRKGEYFGYRPLLAGDPQPVTAAAMDNVVVSFIPRDTFMELFYSSEQLSKRIALTLASEFSVWINKMTIFTQYSVKE
jgi:CRP-like cAMP-binding protein